MKKCLLVTLAFALAAPITSAFAAKSDKIVISYTPAGAGESDCKISRKEIKKAQEAAGAEAFVCGQLSAASGENRELVPSDLGKIVALTAQGNGQLVLKYEGAKPDALLETFNNWIQFLAGTENYASDAAGWNASLESNTETEVVVRFDNSASGESFSVSVVIGDVIE